MTKPSSTTVERATGEQLKTLLGLASRPPGQRESVALLGTVTDLDELRKLLSECCGAIGESGDLLLATSCDEKTPIEALRSIKDIAKKLRAKAPSEAHRQAATLLYHAAIAAAFARYGINLSSRSVDSRSELYEDLAIAFVAEPLGEVFRLAVDRAMNGEGVMVIGRDRRSGR